MDLLDLLKRDSSASPRYYSISKHFLKVNEVFYLTEYPTFDVFSLFRKRLPYHASPMQAFVFDQSLSDCLFQNYDPYINENI